MFNYEFPRILFSDKMSPQEELRVFYSFKDLKNFLEERFYPDLKRLKEGVTSLLNIDFERSLSGESFTFIKSPLLKKKSIKGIFEEIKDQYVTASELRSFLDNFGDARYRYSQSVYQLEEKDEWSNNEFLVYDGSDITSTSTPIIDTSFFSLRTNNLESFPESEKLVGCYNRQFVYFDFEDLEVSPKGVVQIHLGGEDSHYTYALGEVMEYQGEVFLTSRLGTNLVAFSGATINFAPEPLLVGNTFSSVRFVYSKELNTFMIVGTGS